MHRSSVAGTCVGGPGPGPALQRVSVLPQRSSRRPQAQSCVGPSTRGLGRGAGRLGNRTPGPRGRDRPLWTQFHAGQPPSPFKCRSPCDLLAGRVAAVAPLPSSVPVCLEKFQKKLKKHERIFPPRSSSRAEGGFTRGVEKTSVGRLFRLLPPGTWLHFPAAPPLARAQPAPLCPPGCTWRPRALPAAHLT